MPFLSPGDLPGPGIEPRSPALQADFLLTELPGKNRWVCFAVIYLVIDFVFLCVHILFSRKERKKKKQSGKGHKHYKHWPLDRNVVAHPYFMGNYKI